MSRSLWPREHGAYAQLLAPLVTALVVVQPTWISGALALAACLAFLANEPLLVVLGHRGRRMRETAGARAKRRLAVLVAGAVVAGAAALAYAPPRVLEVAAAVAVPTLVTIVFAWRRAEKSVAGECVAALALSGASAPVLVASGVSWHIAAALWAAWALGYGCTVVAVHRVIARHRAAASWVDVLAAVVLAGVSALAIVLLLGSAPLSLVGVSAPLALASLVLAVWPPPATYLRTIGVVLVGASLAAGALAIAML